MRTNLVARLTYVIFLVAAKVTSQDCPTYWVSDSRDQTAPCYLITNKIQRTFTEARKFCNNMGGDLLIINSVQERDSVYGMVQTYKGYYPTHTEWWIGMTDSVMQTAQAWVDGSSVTQSFLQWYGQEPAQYDRSKKCVVTYNNTLRHENCDSTQYFICERTRSTGLWCDSRAGWESINGKCYKITTRALPWDAARAECQTSNANLMVIEDDATEQTLYDLIESRQSDMWIGLRAIPAVLGYALKWVGLSNKDLDVIHAYWTPDIQTTQNALGIAISSNGTSSCVIANHTSGARNNWQMVDCGTRAFSICQKPSGRCASGWIQHGIKCYRIVTEVQTTLLNAQTFCQDRNANLLTIKSSDVQTFINSQLSDLRQRRINAIWLGLTDASMNQWTWSDGSAIFTPPYSDFSNLNGQTLNGSAPGLDCMNIFTDDVNGTWQHASSCNNNNSFICEIGVGRPPAVPTLPPGASTIAPIQTTGAAWSTECGPFWVLDSASSYCYRFSDDTVTWFQARSLCQNDSAQLASVTSIHEQNFLANSMFAYRSPALWLGANDLATNKGFNWIDGSGFAFLNWSPGEPNNLNKMEQCLEVTTGGQNVGLWNDISCTSQRGYVCKKKSSHFPTVLPPSKPQIPNGQKYGCPSAEWFPEVDTCWLIRTDALSWTKARAKCQNLTSELASITDEFQQNFLYSVLPLVTRTRDRFWIGLNDIGNQMRFQWTDKSPVTYTNWAVTEPNNFGNRAEDCVSIEVWDAAQRKGEWNDDICEEPLQGYICKLAMAAVPANTPQMDRSMGCTGSNGLTYGPKCFQLSPAGQVVSWNAAQAQCRSQGGQLVTILNELQQAFLASQLKAPSSYWIGLSNVVPGNTTLTWVNGAGLTYTAWASGHTGAEINTCMAMQTSSPGVGLWIHQDCGNLKPYICEYPRAGWSQPSQTAAPVTAPYVCPSGWNDVNGYCYNVFSTKLSWFSARVTCRSLGANLASFHSRSEEQQALRYGYYTVWIGLNDLDTEKGYTWTDGTGLNYTNWAQGEPNDSDGTDDCVEVNAVGHNWNDNSCYIANAYMCKIIKGVPLRVQPTSVQPTQASACNNDPNWRLFNGSCYYVSQPRASWYDARDFCAQNGGDLMSAHSLQENNFLITLMTSTVGSDCWIGLFDKGSNQFGWADGTPVDYTHWSGNEPNDAFGSENCGQIQAFNGYWNDNDCNEQFHYICKRPLGGVTPGLVPTTPLIQGGCPPGFIAASNDNKCYSVIGGTDPVARKNYTDALAYCRQNASDLASITSQTELAVLISIFLSAVQDGTGLWIGLNDNNNNYRYTWQDSARLNYTHWDKGEPNGFGERCVEIYTDARKAGRWNNIVCSNVRAFICEASRAPIYTTPAISACADLQGNGNLLNPNTFDCYNVQMTPMSWTDASSACASRQMTLASVLSVYDQAFIDTLVVGFNSPVWIGLSDPGLTGTYTWTDQFPLTFTNWDKGEPTYTAGEGCIATRNGLWNDTVCANTYPSVCKKPFFPPATPTPNLGGYCANVSWSQFGNNCYFLELKPFYSWSDAETQCKQRGMELASVMSNEEEAFVLREIDNNDRASINIWIGFRRTGGYFVWSDGNPTSYIHWDGSPSGLPGYDCVIMQPTNGKWSNRRCIEHLGFICKGPKLPATTPTTTISTPSTTTPSTLPPPASSSSSSSSSSSAAPSLPSTSSTTSSKSPADIITTSQGQLGSTTSSTGPKATIPNANELQKQQQKQLPALPPTMSGGAVAGVITGILLLLALVCIALIVLKTRYGDRYFSFMKFTNQPGIDNAAYDKNTDTVRMNGVNGIENSHYETTS
ncbi:macrophage mannose receptor 1-like [Dreissena polymorpha]|uniref:macrophage mannose receptor 1-like n=1 Tax=Dreissena polymorpha TaxID=45954 RepID=UPI002264429A|nr:macrophage mannose receptor 1-like [Dreissena polymorpha]